MKKWFTALALFSFFQISFGQDDAILAAPLGSILAPTTGCALTATETVTVRIFNSGPGTINAPFDVSYNITGPVNSAATETVMVGSIPMNSTFTYTFTTTADLSTAGVYTMSSTVTVAGDPNASNNAYTGYSITNNAASNGGTATGGTTVCFGANSGNITLSGSTGNVLNWEYSDDLGITWFNISNTTTSQSYDDLTVETWYRANVQNATCPVATSTIAIMQISPTSVGGTTAGGTTPACQGANSGTVTLSGKTGNVLNWESSPDGVTWTNIVNTTTSNPYLNLTTTTRFRAQVKSGVCPAVYSSQRIITINPTTVGGTVTTSATECAGSNSATLNLGGNVGTVQNWQSSTDGGTSWTPITNTTTSQAYTNLTTTTMYRAQVKSGACPVASSGAATITIVPNSNGGTISSSMTVCNGANDDTLALSGFAGTVLDWEMSTDGGLTYSSTGNTNDSLFFTNLTVSTVYRAVVQAGSCPSANSTPVTVSIDQPSIGGTLASDATECASGNSGSIDLLGQTGTPTSWESSTDFGMTWSAIANTTTSLNYTNLTDTTWYRSIVKNGTCASQYSDTVTITVDPVTVGGTVNSNATICAAGNSGTLTLTGQTGNVLNWESSSDGGFTWVSIANTTPSQGYLNLTTNTLYRAVVQSGICPGTISSIATLTVDNGTSAGNILGATTVCESFNSGSLTLVGTSGSVLDWEASTDGGVTWTPTGNPTSVENFNNLTATTDYRAIATSGVCPNDTSATATVVVDAITIGGSVTQDSIVCELSNSDILTLAGHNGSVLNWEMSTDGGSTWIILGNTTTFQNYLDLTTTTSYRANVKNGVCAAAPSTMATISVSPESIGGAVTSSSTVCQNINSGTLTLTAHDGVIQHWESSSDGGATWTYITNTGIVQNFAGLTDTTWYRALVQNGNCPVDTSAIAFINVNEAPVADFIQDTTCLGGPLNFVNATTYTQGFVTLYSWDFGDGNSSTLTNPSHTYAIAGPYNVTLFVMNNFGCSDTVMRQMMVYPSPSVIVTAAGPTSFCEGDSVQVGSTFTAGLNYLWNNGETTNMIYADTTGTFTLVVTDPSNGCTATDSISAVVFPNPVADAGLDTNVSIGFSVPLAGSGGTSYAWSPTEGLDNVFIADPNCSPLVTTTYTLVVTDDNGCTASDSVLVTINGTVVLTIYDIITPNGDNFNDTWVIDNLVNFPNNTVSVFNRYGQVVYEANSYANDWDGTRGGDELPEGAYFYIIELTDSGESFKGTLNIVRSN